MTDPFIVRQATLADKDSIFEFLQTAYSGRARYKFPYRWEWEFEHNPFREPSSLPIWIALDQNGKVVGQSCALMEPLVLEGLEYRVGWGVDFYVLPECRGVGLGKKLQVANSGGNVVFMSLSMTGPTRKIKQSIGMQPLQSLPAYMKILRHEPASVLDTAVKRYPFLPKGVLKGLRLDERTAEQLTARAFKNDQDQWKTRDTGITIRVLKRFGKEIEPLWESLSPKFTGLVRRDAKYLNWKYGEQPHMIHDKLAAYRGEDISGYIVLRKALPPERNAGIISDIFVDPEDEDTIRTLLLHSIRAFRKAGAIFISAASSVPGYQTGLEALDFKETQSVTPLIRAHWPVPESGWLLGKGDHDWDQYPLA